MPNDLTPTQQLLQTELQRPEYADMIAAGSDAGILAAIQARNIPGDPYIDIMVLASILGSHLCIPAFKRAVANDQLPQILRDYCDQMLWSIENKMPLEFRLNNPTTQAGMVAVVQAGIMAQSVVDEINAAGATTMLSVQDVRLNGASISLNDISYVLRGDR